MARYAVKNKTARVSKAVEAENLEDKVVKNKAGGNAYQLSEKEELATLVLTSFMGDEYYESADARTKRIRELVAKQPYYAAQCAVYARNEHGLRSVSHVLVDAIVNSEAARGEGWTRRFVNKAVFRVDDMTEILALQLQRGKKGIPNSLKRGLADSFDKFDGYQLSKYRGEKRDVSLIDVVNLVHPKPTAKNAEALKQLVEGTLRSTETWEAKLTKAGQDAKTDDEKAALKDQAWGELVASRKIGYLALLRNLRNIVNDADAEVLRIALEMLVDPVLIKKSKIFPFQFLSAYTQVTDRKVRTALNKAIEISLDNLPEFEGRTLIAVDHSGSMGDGIGSNKFIGDLFAAALWRKNSNADLVAFGGWAKYVTMDSGNTLLSLAEKLGMVDVDHSTNLSAVFGVADKKYDRVFIFSDMQTWADGRPYDDSRAGRYSYYGRSTPKGAASEGSFKDYCKKYDVDPYVYSFDLGGYGSTQFKPGNTKGKHMTLAGFSEKIFDIVGKHETEPSALVAEIEKIVL